MKNDVMVYTTPEVDFIVVAAEHGFSNSFSVDEWEDGENIKDGI